jgi:hypothetical protein
MDIEIKCVEVGVETCGNTWRSYTSGPVNFISLSLTDAEAAKVEAETKEIAKLLVRIHTKLND